MCIQRDLLLGDLPEGLGSRDELGVRASLWQRSQRGVVVLRNLFHVSLEDVHEGGLRLIIQIVSGENEISVDRGSRAVEEVATEDPAVCTWCHRERVLHRDIIHLDAELLRVGVLLMANRALRCQLPRCGDTRFPITADPFMNRHRDQFDTGIGSQGLGEDVRQHSTVLATREADHPRLRLLRRSVLCDQAICSDTTADTLVHRCPQMRITPMCACVCSMDHRRIPTPVTLHISSAAASGKPVSVPDHKGQSTGSLSCHMDRTEGVEIITHALAAVEAGDVPVPVTELWVYGDLALGLDPMHRMDIYVRKELLLEPSDPAPAGSEVRGIGETVDAAWAQRHPDAVRTNAAGFAAPERCLAAQLVPADAPVHLEVCNAGFEHNVRQRLQIAVDRDDPTAVIDPRAVCLFAEDTTASEAIGRLTDGAYVFPPLAEALEMLGAPPAFATEAAAAIGEDRRAAVGRSVRADVV